MTSSPSPEPDLFEHCAATVVAVVPQLMREIRTEMRQAAPAGLSVPLFRALIFARNHPGASLTALAAHLGVTLPTASVGVDKLIRLGLLQESCDAAGTRAPRRALRLSSHGEQSVAQALNATTRAMAERLRTCDPATLARIEHSLTELHASLADTATCARG